MNHYRRRLHRRGILVFCILTLSLSQLCRTLSAGLDFDPKPPIRWKEMLSCQLVLLAKYEKHEGASLSLRVVRVLKGRGMKKGDIVPVKLAHRYTLVTGLTGWEAMTKDGKADGVPKLCYKTQIMNPGPLVPVKIIPDVREPNIYFLPNAADRALAARGQVQHAILLDGWQQALDGKPMSLIFRLVQPVNPDLARNALEELYAKRDKKALQQLFDWMLNPPLETGYYTLGRFSAADTLIAIGDRDGDVYDPLLKLLKEEAAGTNQYRFSIIAGILAQVAPEKALKDFSEIIATGKPEVKKAVAGCVGETKKEKALELIFRLLREPDLADAAVSSLREFLDTDRRRVRISPVEQARLNKLAGPMIAQALTWKNIPKEPRRILKVFLDYRYKKPPEIDLESATKTLLNPKEPTYRGYAHGEGHKILEQLKAAPRKEFVPLLVKVLHDIPKARKDWTFAGALVAHARAFPDAVRKGLVKHGLDGGFGSTTDAVDSISFDLYVAVGILNTCGQLTSMLAGPDHAVRRWLRKYKVPAHLVSEFKQSIENDVAGTSGPSWWDLQLLLRIAPNDAKRLLERALEKRKSYRGGIGCGLLAFAVKCGRKELCDELITTVHNSMKEKRSQGSIPSSPRFLLLAGDERALREYLKILDSAKRLRSNPFYNSSDLDYEYTQLLGQLFPSHPGDYFKRVLALLESDSLPVRERGQELLKSSLHTTLGYDCKAFASQRAQVMKKLKPLLKEFHPMTELEIRGRLLKELGVTLEGNASKDWLPALEAASKSPDPALAQNARWLIYVMKDE